MAGLSQDQVVSRMSPAVSKAMLSKYEKGQSLPDSTRLISLAKALGVAVDYFFQTPTLELEKVEFRKKSRLGAKEQERILTWVAEQASRYLELESLTGTLRPFENPQAGVGIQGFEDVEQAAIQLREHWQLGLNPIPNVLELLEEVGIKVFEVEADKRFDGLSAWIGESPVIAINASFDAVRKRFTALHELGHLLLNFSPELEEQVEPLCHTFANAFLIPKPVFLRAFGQQQAGRRHKVAVEELKGIKAIYGISIQALMKRAQQLQLITYQTYRQFNIYLNTAGLRENEPGYYQGEEQPKRFRQLLFRAAAEELITMSKAAVLGSMTLQEFRKDFVVL